MVRLDSVARRPVSVIDSKPVEAQPGVTPDAGGGAPAADVSTPRPRPDLRTVRDAREVALAAERQQAALLQSRTGPAASSLRTEVLGDGHANCLELAANGARGHQELVFMDDRRAAGAGNADGAGHVLVRDPASGRVWDPNDGPPPTNTSAWKYRSADAWAAAQGFGAEGGPAYKESGAVRASEVQDVLRLPPEQRAAHIAGNPALGRVEHMLVADGQDPDVPNGAAAGLGLPPLANVVDGTHGTAASTAVQILETMADGRPAFRPELGQIGGVQWFVTEGTPHVGRGTSNPVTIPVEIEVPRGSLQFGEAELTRIYQAELGPARTLAEQQFRQRNNLAPTDPLNSRAQNTIRFNAERIAERQMWTRVGEQVARSESGVGRVTLQNSRFSRGGDGTFTLTSRPEAVRVRGGANALVEIIQRTGEPVERPVLQAAEQLASRERWAGRVQGAFRVGGRVLIVAGAVADGYRIYQADDRLRESVRVAGGWAGATAAGGAFATWASPSLATGPWGWLGYGLGTLGAGAVGYFAGESIAEEAYELVVDGDPIYVGPGD
ncbi:MAG: hypothetical protein IPG45_21775 [Deltaproteobacteria bacterium]|nr:hypothetical protein [Deltaproteobacteria bacterium]